MEIIVKKGFDPTNFEGKETKVGGRHAFVIKLKNSTLRFVIRNADDDYHAFDFNHSSFGPGHSKTEYSPRSSWTNIEVVYDAFEKWLEKAVRVYFDDLVEPDLWKQVEQQRPLFTGSIFDEREISPFSDNEKEQLRLAIKKFESLIPETLQASQEELKVVREYSKYLSEALERLNRFDWRGLAIATILGISIALSLDTEKGKILFNLFKDILSSFGYLLQ